MNGPARAPSSACIARDTTLSLALQQVIGLVQDVEPDTGRLRPDAQAGGWVRSRHVAGHLPEGRT